MKLRTYKVLRGYYDEVKEKELHVPENGLFLCKDGSCGHCVHTGHNHYIMILPKEYYTNDDIDTIMDADTNALIGHDEFGDFHILTFDDIKFIDEYPEITATQAMTVFGLDKYYVVWKKRDFWNDEVLEDILSGKISINERAAQMTKGEVYRVGKVLDFAGPYDITLFNVYIGNYFDDQPTYGMTVSQKMEINNIAPSSYNLTSSGKDKIYVTKDPTLFNELKEKVLHQIDYYNA